MQRVRSAAVAGAFYPAEAGELRRLLEECFVSNPLGPKGAHSPSPYLLGGMVPHAGYIYSGACAAHLYSMLGKDIRLVILLGVNHRGHGAVAALSSAEFWQTPLGRVEVDRDLGERLRTHVDFLAEDGESHREEHSIEVQLPFLQSVLGEFALLPVSLSYLTLEECRRLGEAIARLYETQRGSGEKLLLLASSDLDHYQSPKETERLDRMALAKVLALDPAGLLATVEENDISMCGVIPTAVFLFAANALGAKQARLLKHCHSGDAMPMKEVVGYASVAVEF
ncbi:MAG: AmmeMemoRadiSam system protein B [Candidatus Binatia bacterium]